MSPYIQTFLCESKQLGKSTISLFYITLLMLTDVQCRQTSQLRYQGQRFYLTSVQL